jgi:Snf7
MVTVLMLLRCAYKYYANGSKCRSSERSDQRVKVCKRVMLHISIFSYHQPLVVVIHGLAAAHHIWKSHNAYASVPSQVIALEGSNMNYQTFRAMQSGAKAMQQARGQLDVDDVDQVHTANASTMLRKPLV